MANIDVPAGGFELDEDQIANFRKLVGRHGVKKMMRVNNDGKQVLVNVSSSVTEIGCCENLHSVSVETPDMVGGFDFSLFAVENVGESDAITVKITSIGSGTLDQVKRLLGCSIFEI